MDQIVTIVLPVFGIIGVGYLVAWTGLISAETGDAIADFVFAVPIPVLIFRTIATAEIPDGLTPILLLCIHMFSFLIVWAAGTIVVRRIFKRDARAGVVGGIAAGYGNAFMLGIPLVVTAYGEEALIPISLLVSLQLPVLLALSAVLIERATLVDGVAEVRAGSTKIAANAVKNVVFNPIIVGAIVGLAWRFGGFEMSGAPQVIVDKLADVAGTLALLALGLGLAKYGVSGNARPAIVLGFLKLGLMPAIALAIVAFIVPLPPIWAKVIVIAAACPSGGNVYLVASRFRTGQALASNTIVLTTVMSIVSITFWLGVAELLL